jgi:hypothetical protein
VAEALILEEVSTFMTAYYTEKLHRPGDPTLVTTSTRIHRTSASSEGISKAEA